MYRIGTQNGLSSPLLHIDRVHIQWLRHKDGCSNCCLPHRGPKSSAKSLWPFGRMYRFQELQNHMPIHIWGFPMQCAPTGRRVRDVILSRQPPLVTPLFFWTNHINHSLSRQGKKLWLKVVEGLDTSSRISRHARLIQLLSFSIKPAVMYSITGLQGSREAETSPCFIFYSSPDDSKHLHWF